MLAFSQQLPSESHHPLFIGHFLLLTLPPFNCRFEINLLCGSVVSDELIKNGNIAMHMAIIPSGGYALLNSRTGKTWNKEERTPRGRLPAPLLQNQSFKMVIEVERNQYRVDVNGHQFVTFLHRHALESVGLLSYEGDFDVDNVQIQPPPQQAMEAMYPFGGPTSSYENNDHVLFDMKFPRLPMLLPLKPGLSPGMLISIDGRITGNRFDISLYQGSNPYGDPSSDVAFHLEVYMKEMLIVRNSNQNNQWLQPEKEVTHFPFFGQSQFQMAIRVEANRFQVSVSGRYVFDFYHRVGPLHSIDHLCIHGAVEVSSLLITVPPL